MSNNKPYTAMDKTFMFADYMWARPINVDLQEYEKRIKILVRAILPYFFEDTELTLMHPNYGPVTVTVLVAQRNPKTQRVTREASIAIESDSDTIEPQKAFFMLIDSCTGQGIGQDPARTTIRRWMIYEELHRQLYAARGSNPFKEADQVLESIRRKAAGKEPLSAETNGKNDAEVRLGEVKEMPPNRYSLLDFNYLRAQDPDPQASEYLAEDQGQKEKEIAPKMKRGKKKKLKASKGKVNTKAPKKKKKGSKGPKKPS